MTEIEEKEASMTDDEKHVYHERWEEQFTREMEVFEEAFAAFMEKHPNHIEQLDEVLDLIFSP